MFVSQEHNSQVLPRQAYFDPEIYKNEIERIMLPAWHCVAVMDELPKNGSFVTMDLFDRPIILWRNDDEVSAFLNVCSHRYAKLTCKSCGVADRLHCQYHGWEYDEMGNVRKIPEAKTFRPLAQGMLGLKRYRVERCGELVFINLAEEGPSLREFLGDKFDLYESWFTPEMHTAIVMSRKINANWKCLIENALESYHTSEVHPKTFGETPKEKDCTHQLHDAWTSLVVDFSQEKSFRALLDKVGHWAVGRTRDSSYEHILHYPNVMLARLSLYRWVECVIPISPNESLSVVRLMCFIGEQGKLRRLWNRALVSKWAKDFLIQVGNEDAAILPQIQAGISAADEPVGGLLSTREERIFHFQYYIERASQPTVSCDDNEVLSIRFSGNPT